MYSDGVRIDELDVAVYEGGVMTDELETGV